MLIVDIYIYIYIHSYYISIYNKNNNNNNDNNNIHTVWWYQIITHYGTPNPIRHFIQGAGVETPRRPPELDPTMAMRRISGSCGDWKGSSNYFCCWAKFTIPRAYGLTYAGSGMAVNGWKRIGYTSQEFMLGSVSIAIEYRDSMWNRIL